MKYGAALMNSSAHETAGGHCPTWAFITNGHCPSGGDCPARTGPALLNEYISKANMRFGIWRMARDGDFEGNSDTRPSGN
ncbi:unnamed protein product, partial [Nesidiocoris tenuis]